jgi:hypothetical protein
MVNAAKSTLPTTPGWHGQAATTSAAAQSSCPCTTRRTIDLQSIDVETMRVAAAPLIEQVAALV